MSVTNVDLLRQVPIFAELEEASLQMLAARCRRRRFKESEALFHQGDPGFTLYIIVSGSVNIQTIMSSGDVVHHAQRGPGEYVGEMSLIDGKPRMADAVTAEPCDLLMLQRDEFIQSIEESPLIALGVMACLADRLREAADHLESHKGLDVLGRVSALLLELMETRGVEDASGRKQLDVKISQQEIAERAGTTRESVNRAFSSLKSVGAIRSEGRRIVVLNAKKLRQYGAK